MDTAAAFLRSIEANLAEPAPLLIYADWLEEQGKEQLAHAWRWMGRRGYRPANRAGVPLPGRTPGMPITPFLPIPASCECMPEW